MNRLLKVLIPLSLFVSQVKAVLATHIGGTIHPTTNPPATINIEAILTRTIDWGFGLLLAIASLLVLWAGFLYLQSGGDEDKVKSAKNYIIYAVIAIVVAFGARGLVTIVEQLVGVKT